MQSRVFEYPNATVRVHFPDVAEAERERRLKEIKLSAELVLKALLKSESNTGA